MENSNISSDPGFEGEFKRPPHIPNRPTISNEEGANLLEIWSVLRRRRGIIFGCAIICTIISAAIIFQLTSFYTAEASVLLEMRKTQVIDMQAVMSGLSSDTAAIRSEVEVIRSPAVAAAVVKKLNLTTIAEFNPRLEPAAGFSRVMGLIRPTLETVEDQVKSLFGAASLPPVPDKDPAKAEITGAIRRLMSRVEVINDGRSYVLKVRVTSESPQLAQALANAVADAYLDQQLEAKFEAVRRANDWLNEHVTDLRQKLEDSDRAVQVFKAQHNISESRGETLTGQQLGELNSQLILATADRAQKESNLRQLQDQLRTGGIDGAIQVLDSSLLQRLREQKTDLLTKEADLATRYKPAHPAIINIKAQEHDLDRKIQDEIQKVIQAKSGDVAAARARESSLRQSLAELQKTSGVQNETAVQLRELEREAEANRTLYENFLNRFKQTSAQEDIQQADARVIAPASLPGAASFPRRGLMISIALLGSALLGVFLAFAVERTDHGFRNGDQLEKMANVATLGLVPDFKGGGTSPEDTVIKRPISPYAEAIRTVRTALRYSNVDSPPKVVMVTSSLPNEGKTTFALSLARSVAVSGGKSLLIDCDLRHPALAKIMNVPDSPGLLDIFEEDGDKEGAIRVDEPSGMHYIVVAHGTTNPQDLLASHHMRALIERLRPLYDMIVLDTPPVLAVSDPLILSHLTDTTMYLVRWVQTSRPVVMGALKTFRTNGGTLAGVVLSRVNFRKHAAYGYGDSGYYYGYYGSYYRQSREGYSGYNRKT